jgi:hypothetical protein
VGFQDVEDHVLPALAGDAFAQAQRFGEFEQLHRVLALELGEVDQPVAAADVGVLVVVHRITVRIVRPLRIAAALAALLIAFVATPTPAAIAVVASFVAAVRPIRATLAVARVRSGRRNFARFLRRGWAIGLVAHFAGG